MKLNKKRSWILLLSTITMLSIAGCGGDGKNGASSNNNLLYELYLPIYYPGQPVDPTNPGSPIYPTDPTDPTDPIDPTDPVDPTAPTNPGSPTDPIDPTDPVDPTAPTNPGSPIYSTDPIDPTDNLPPVAIGSATPASVVVDSDFSTRIIFDGSASYDQDTLIQPITYVWTAGSHEVKNVVAEAYASCANKYTDCANNVCVYTAYLEVSDGELSDIDKVVVNVDYNNCIDEVLPLPCDELIKDKPDRTYITNNPETVVVNEDVQLHLWGVYAEGTECELTYESAAVWSSNDENIASTDSKGGRVTGVAVGTATIEAKYRAVWAELSTVYVIQ